MTKERLRNYGQIKKEIFQLREKIQELKIISKNAKVPEIGGVGHGVGGATSPVENAVMMYLELERIYQAKLTELAAEQKAIENAIESLESVERQILRYRYIDGMMWERICLAVGYSWQQTHRIHARALEKIRDK